MRWPHPDKTPAVQTVTQSDDLEANRQAKRWARDGGDIVCEGGLDEVGGRITIR